MTNAIETGPGTNWANTEAIVNLDASPGCVFSNRVLSATNNAGSSDAYVTNIYITNAFITNLQWTFSWSPSPSTSPLFSGKVGFEQKVRDFLSGKTVSLDYTSFVFGALAGAMAIAVVALLSGALLGRGSASSAHHS